MEFTSGNILVWINSTFSSEGIIKQALFFTEKLKLHLFVFYLLNKPSRFKKLIFSRKLKETEENSLKSVRRFLKDIAVTEENFKNISCRIKSENTLPLLLKQSKIGGYDFIITGKKSSGNGLKASKLDKFLRLSECPVLILTEEHIINQVKEIVIPVDISQSTPKKLLWASYFAKKFDAQITIVSALNLNIETKRSLAWRNAERIKHMLSKRGIKSEIEVLKSEGKDKHNIILEYIETKKPDMIIIRTHQEAHLTGKKIGKFVSGIINGSTVPIFAVTQFVNYLPKKY